MRRGARLSRTAAVLAAIVLGATPVAAAGAAKRVAAITTPGTGTLTKCRDWLFYESCDKYHHVELPTRVAVGDAVDLVFGSSMKQYTFHVAVIRRTGHRCTLLTEAGAAGETGDKLEVSPCAAAKTPAAASR